MLVDSAVFVIKDLKSFLFFCFVCLFVFCFFVYSNNKHHISSQHNRSEPGSCTLHIGREIHQSFQLMFNMLNCSADSLTFARFLGLFLGLSSSAGDDQYIP